MFRWLVPRHQAEVAATTWAKKTAAATARQKRRRNASSIRNRSPRTTPKENPSRGSEPVGGIDTGWLAEEVENLPLSIVAPANGRSATIRPNTKLTIPAELRLLMQGTEDQNIDTSLQFLGWCPVFRELAGALAWGVGDPFRMNITGLKKQSDLRRHNLTWNGSPISKKSCGPCRSAD